MFTVRNFLKAAERGDTDAVKDYLRRRDAQDCIKAVDEESNTALHLAAKNGHAETLQVLIDAGMDVAAKNRNGFTPLAAAAWGNNGMASLPVLLNAGADVNVKIPNWGSILCMTVSQYNCNAVMARALLAAKADPNAGKPLMNALEQRQWDLAEDLLKAGAKPEAVADNNGYRPLHYAAQYGQEKLVMILLDKDVDVNVSDRYSNTPLHLAISHGNADIVRQLLERGADTEAVNNYGRNALAHAQQSNHSAAMVKLVEPYARAAIAKRATPLNATAEQLPDRDAETWVLMGEQKVARVSVHPALKRRLTEIFNFESRERIIISENLKTNAETVTPPVSFDQTPEKLLAKALDALRDLGGSAEDDAVFATRMPKKTLKPGS